MESSVSVSESRVEITALIGRNIRLARRLAGDMSQGDVLRAQSELIDPDVDRPFTREQLSAWENAHYRPQDHYLRRIALITDQPLSFFFESHDDSEV